MAIYTNEDWSKDQTFSAQKGQEITQEIYERMFNALPPLRLKNSEGCTAGFRMSEPYTHKNGKALYMAFGKRNGKYYYLGLQ